MPFIEITISESHYFDLFAELTITIFRILQAQLQFVFESDAITVHLDGPPLVYPLY